MTTPRDFDAIVVGAGPAGANAALELARGGRSVALVEKEELPRYKTCGGGVVGRALAELPASVRAAIEVECRTVEMHFDPPRPPGPRPGPQEEWRDFSFAVRSEEPVVSMAMRADLDLALTAAAVEAGAELLSPCRATGLDAGRDNIALDTGGGVLRAPFLVAADGATSRVASAAGWTSAPASIPAAEWEVRVDGERRERFGHAARFDFGAIPRGYAWVFPKREHLSVGALLVHRDRAPLPALLNGYLDQLGLGGAESVQRHGWMIPIRPRPGGLTRGRVLLAGDAAGLADPLTAEGISHALASGRLAARAVLASCDPAEVRRGYESELERKILSELRLARRLARILYARRPPRWLFRRLGQTFCDGLGQVVAGRTTYGELLGNPRNYGRLLLRLTRGSPGRKGSASSPGPA